MQVNKEPTNKHITEKIVRQVGYPPEPFNFQQWCKGKFRVQK
jgi:hypothetical protein